MFLVIFARNQSSPQHIEKKTQWKHIFVIICEHAKRITLTRSPASIRCSEPNLVFAVFLKDILDPYILIFATETSSHRDRYGSFLFKINSEPVGATGRLVPGFASNGKLCSKGVRPASPRSPMMGDFVEAAEIVRIFLEFGNAPPVGNVPQRPNHRHERGLPRTVLANEQGQGGQAGCLPFAKATEVLQGDLVHGVLCSVTLALPAAWRPSSTFQCESKGTRWARCLQVAVATMGNRGCSPVRSSANLCVDGVVMILFQDCRRLPRSRLPGDCSRGCAGALNAPRPSCRRPRRRRPAAPRGPPRRTCARGCAASRRPPPRPPPRTPARRAPA